MILSVDEALSSASDTWTKETENENGKIHTLLQVFGCLIERVKKHMGRLFVRIVANAAERAIVNDEEEARRMTVDAAQTRRIC